ncbi:MAG: hypothetical protein ABW252_15420 [Polyangiales bacterium]
MKKIQASFAAFLAIVASASAAAAEDAGACAITTTRTACAGQETESYKKCDGKQSCTKNVEASSADACLEAAVAACANDRPTVTKSKKITAKYQGKAVKPKSGKDDVCLSYEKRAAEFDQCSPKK